MRHQAIGFEDLRQSREWGEYLTRLGWQVEKCKVKSAKCKVFIRRLPLVGSLIKIQRPQEIPPVEEIDRIAKKHRSLFVKLEPAYQSSIPGFEPDNWPLLPSRTIWVDLTPSEEEILAALSKDARYSIRKAQRLGVKVAVSEDLETFHNLFRETGKRKKFWVPPFADLEAKVNAFNQKSFLILAHHGSEIVAGALILFHDSVVYYHHAAANLKGRQLLAPYLIVWEAIKLSKGRGCHTLDLEGVYDPRYKIYRRWKSISVFKRKFGGREVEYPGSYIKYYNLPIRLFFKVGSFVTDLL